MAAFEHILPQTPLVAKSRQGFTLIELLVVTAIIVLLFGVTAMALAVFRAI